MDILVAYDIAGTDRPLGARRLRRVAKICQKYGERVQLSVFECRLSPTKLARLVGEIEDAIDSRQDSVTIYRFPGQIADARQQFGRTSTRSIGDPWLL